MATLFGKQLRRQEILERVGNLSQLAGIRFMEMNDGLEQGVRIADVRTGSGLRVQVTLDRGMDISVADYKGIPLAWRSPVGDVHPSFFEPAGSGFRRTFPGGLMTGCGLTSAGAPSNDQGEELGLHGRLSHLPAFDVAPGTEWIDDECLFRLEGSVRQNSLFAENLLLRRRIEVFLGRSVITVHDAVSNEGTGRTPLMMLYHVNAGWPVVDEGSRLLLHARETQARDAIAAPGLPYAKAISSPIPHFREQVFYHDLIADHEGFVTALLLNRRLQLGLYVRCRQHELPKFAEWKMMGQGEYVVGLEPANCTVEGRVHERASGSLEFIDPGEKKEFLLSIGVLDGEDQINEFIRDRNLQ